MSSEEETDISESEMEDYADTWYQKLKEGYGKEKISGKVYQCPFCPGKKKQAYSFNDLVQHSSGVSKASSRKVNDKGKHLGLTKYLNNDLLRKDSFPMETELQPIHHENDADQKYAFPWMGIVANLPTEWKDGRYVGKSGSGLRDDLTSKGFNPLRVHPLWNCRGHSGKAVVEFDNDWTGFANAIKFQKSYESQHQGKKDYLVSQDKGDKLYGWIAKTDDYNSSDIIGDYLRKTGDLKSISEVEAEEKRKTDSLVSNLSNTIEAKRRSLKEIESKCNETSMSLKNVMRQRDAMVQEYNEDLQRMAKNAHGQLEKMFKEQEKSKSYFEARRKALELREKELVEREALNDSQREELHLLKQMNERAAMEQKKFDESVLILAEEHKKAKETLRQKNMELQKKLDLKQALELEIERLTGAMQVTKHMGDGQDVKKKLDEIDESVKEKKEELEGLEALNQALVVKEQKTAVELNDARKELSDGMKENTSRALIIVKRMGDLEDLWNNKLGRKASLKEGITYLLQQLKASKAKKR
ncbi:factor of DNA methylation 4 [Capsicum annuum]